MSQAAAPQAAGGKGTNEGQRRKWLLLVAVFVFSLGGVLGGFYWWRARAASQAAAPGHDAAPAVASQPGVISFESFTVNLADRDAQRFLRVDLRLLLEDATHAKEVAEDDVRMLRLRSAILELLSQQTAGPLTTPEGKVALKQAIAKQATSILAHVKVTDVLFSEFVVQF